MSDRGGVIHVPPPTSPRPQPDPPPQRSPNMTAVILPGFMHTVSYCHSCGREVVEYWQPEGGYNTATGKRNGRRATKCPAWRWWRRWHHHGGWLLTPPPQDRG